MRHAGELLHSHGIGQEDYLLGLNPGAIFGDAKRWPPERFAMIGDMAVEKWGARVVIMGSQSEVGICNTLDLTMSHNALNLCGKTSLGEAIGVIGKCNFFLTNDSGLMHISAALGVPTLAIFGSTDHVATSPRGPKTKIVKHDIECAPCLKPECPTDHRCMLSIEPEEIFQAGKQPLKVKARSLFCYWAVREMGVTMTALALKLNMTKPTVSISVQRGERIAVENSFSLLDE